MITGRDVVIGRGVLIIGLVSLIFAMMVGYATVHAQRNAQCGETVTEVNRHVTGDAIADAHGSVRIAARPSRP